MGIATLSLVALDCPDPLALCRFYQGIVGGEIKSQSQSPEWIRLKLEGGCDLGFQLDPNYAAPEWPNGDPPQQLHLDFEVADLDAGERQAVELGARKTDEQPEPDEWRVFLDPVGHPFCLILAGP